MLFSKFVKQQFYTRQNILNKSLASISQLRTFVETLVHCGSADLAAKKLGLTIPQSKSLIRNKEFSAIFLEVYRYALEVEITPSAIKYIKEVISGEAKPDKVRADLAKSVLDRIGLGAIKPHQPNANKGDLEGMSVSDLESHVAHLKEKAANEAKHIDNAPTITFDNSQDLDYME